MSVKEIFESFDNKSKKGFDEDDIRSSLICLLPEDKSTMDEILRSELMAFDFAEGNQDKKSDWGTYFGPTMVWNNGDGTATEPPSIKLVTPEMIDYWENRAKESINPIIIARYSGLVWDFKNKISGTKPSHEICRIYVKALIDLANGDFHKYETSSFLKLKRALSLAIELNNEDLINQTKDSIINFENRHAEDSKPGLWGYSFDLLVENKRVKLTSKEESQIIEELEKKLNRLTKTESETQKIYPSAAEAAAERLAIYYRKNHKSEDVKRVILEVGKAYEKIIGDASAMQSSGWLEDLYRLYNKFNLKEEAAELLLKIRELGPKMASELKLISHSFNLPKKEMEEYVRVITSGSINDVLRRIATTYIPIKDQAKEQIFDLSKKVPLTYLFERQLQDKKGRVTATVGSLENDMEGHIVIQVSQNLYFSSLLLRSIFYESVNRLGLNTSEVIKFIEKTPIISKERFVIIEKALDAYFNGDFLVTIHLLIPQIEEAIRNIVETARGNVLKPSRNGGYHLRTFDEILRDKIILETLGEDFADYFRILFTDQRGWNMRNNVCHGTANPDMFNSQAADRVIHALLCLGLIHKKE